ncbi:MAG: hydroxymethylbilane synthase [bacterium]
MKIRIGTRGSKLALWQANHIKSLLEKNFKSIDVELIIIKTSGDKIQNVSLTEIGGKGLFVKEIEKALLSKQIDIAVHSMKDMPAEIPDGLFIAATPPAEQPWDVIVFNKSATFSSLNEGAIIGTTSLRRIVQLKQMNSKLTFSMLRGNIDTRIKKLMSGRFDAIIVAYAGLHRLGIKPEFMEKLNIIPAAGQGIIAVEIRKNDTEIEAIVNTINDLPTFYRAGAERGFVTGLGANCQIPAGAHAELIDNEIEVTGFIADPEGRVLYKDSKRGTKEEAYNVGLRLAERLLMAGGDRIIRGQK